MNGIFAVYKPKGPTSHDIIDQIRKKTGVRKVGHAGTLDPLAKGVLVVGVGRDATKRLHEVVKKEKEYIATIKLGEQSTTDDAEGETTPYGLTAQFIAPALVNVTIKKFIGQIDQTPPVYSAMKVGGQRAYKLARAGKDVKMQPRKVLIKNIKVLKYEWPYLQIKVVTGPGVYIRSLARDIGKELGVGGYLYELERTRVGDFSKEEAIIIDNSQKSVSPKSKVDF